MALKGGDLLLSMFVSGVAGLHQNRAHFHEISIQVYLHSEVDTTLCTFNCTCSNSGSGTSTAFIYHNSSNILESFVSVALLYWETFKLSLKKH